MSYPHLDDYRLPMPSSTDMLSPASRNGNMLSSTSSDDSQFSQSTSLSFNGQRNHLNNNENNNLNQKLEDTSKSAKDHSLSVNNSSKPSDNNSNNNYFNNNTNSSNNQNEANPSTKSEIYKQKSDIVEKPPSFLSNQPQKGFEVYNGSISNNVLSKTSPLPDSQQEHNNNNNNNMKSNMNQMMQQQSDNQQKITQQDVKPNATNYENNQTISSETNAAVTTTTNGNIASRGDNNNYTNREMQEMRYTNMNGITPTSLASYSNENLMNRIGMTEYDVSSLQTSSHRAYDPSSVSNSTAFERYDPTYPPQRPNMYSYQPSAEEVNSHQKYMLEQQQLQQQQLSQQAMMKVELDDNSGPVYPRPMYHYDPTCGTLPPGFSAINLSVKAAQAAQAAAQAAAFKNSNGAPIMDLSINNISSTSPNFRQGRSPQPGTSPNLVSPQVPSSPGQTLDLSVNRLSQR
jgi:hypothetical protein